MQRDPEFQGDVPLLEETTHKNAHTPSTVTDSWTTNRWSGCSSRHFLTHFNGVDLLPYLFQNAVWFLEWPHLPDCYHMVCNNKMFQEWVEQSTTVQGVMDGMQFHRD